MYRNFQEYRDAWENADKVDMPVPGNLDLELASTCNLRCPSCFIPDPSFESFISQKADDGKPLRRIMPKEMAFRIIDQAAEIGIPALKFNWRGESTLHPDYSEIVKYAQRKLNLHIVFGHDLKNEICLTCGDYDLDGPFIELLANTNANCNDNSIDGLMACTKVMVSLDSMVPETYSKMRVGGDLQKAKNVIWELVRRGHKNLWIRRVLTKLNAHEPFFEAVKQEWGDKVKCSEHACFDRNEKEDHEVSGCDHDDEMPRKYCRYPSQRLLITSAGYAYPCCLDLTETMRVGNINKQTILEIWNGEPMRKLREDLRSNEKSRMTETCKNCESWMSFDVPQRNWVQDREDKIKIGVGNG